MTKQSDTALLIANYGSPRSANVKDVRKYLRQLLNNRHVIKMNAVGRFFLVNCIIAPTRAKHSAAMYAQLQDKRGMPLVYHTEDLVAKLQPLVKQYADVYFGTTCGTHLIKDVCNQIVDAGYKKLLVMPMFPQTHESTTENIIDEVKDALNGKKDKISVSVVPSFYNSDSYIKCMQRLLLDSLSGFDYEKIVFSYHGVPKEEPENGKLTYEKQCYATTQLICKAAAIDSDMAVTAFQSRMRDNWIQPFTDDVVRKLANNGVKNIAVLTPSFTVDCLETVVEISQTLSKEFTNMGGKQFRVVPCLNSEDYWVEAVAQLALKSLLQDVAPKTEL